jgi:hypothetical protein
MDIDNLIQSQLDFEDASKRGAGDLAKENDRVLTNLNKLGIRNGSLVKGFPVEWRTKLKLMPGPPKEIYDNFFKNLGDVNAEAGKSIRLCLGGFSIGDSTENLFFPVVITFK